MTLPALGRQTSRCLPRLHALLLVLGLAGAARAGDTDVLVGAGLGPFRESPKRGLASVQVDHLLDDVPWNLPLGLWGALDVSAHGDHFLGVGPYLAATFQRRWEVAVGSGPGWYQHKTGVDLRCNLEFRSSLYVFYRFENGQRIGAAVSHYSNAGLSKPNPGAEAVHVYWSIPWRHS